MNASPEPTNASPEPATASPAPAVSTPGKLYGVGLGPGDPSLMTVRAVEVIAAADVVAYHSARHGRSIARSIAERHLRADHVEEPLVYPVTTETTDHPGGYAGAMEEFYEQAAARLAAHLEAGRSVAVLAEGDPLFYGSYMHMHKRLAGRYEAEVVPGVTSVQAASARLGRPLVEGEETLTVLPGTLPEDELAARLACADSAAVMKLGRTFPAVRSALETAGRLDEALYVERATMSGERVGRLADVDPSTVPYFAVAVLPSRAPGNASVGVAAATPGVAADFGAVQDAAPADVEGAQDAAPARDATPGEVVVVGLGPAGPLWLTPQARSALAAADELVGYTTYMDRVPVRPGQRRHASDNRVEAERAEFALELARRGRRVAVVSSGDPGVFAMATAVLEAACAEPYKDVAVRVVPGITAAQSAAALAGAPLGHDFAVVSLSDRLKPWRIIEARLRATSEADLVLALYNPASNSRRTQLETALKVLLERRSPGTPVVVARDVGGPEQAVRITTLAALDPATVDMRCVLLIGSSQTHVAERGDGTTVAWTSRRYPD
ncbi:precorrin-2 C(20)-methyltransferase [Streptomyces sp. ICBB 8177]|uniref:precorrin-2 C(20)-methyltransferase n=1 Tax=Streptomyces sp. ICBB 8177 TaxID=563922 RepID=UPI000D68445F|nr:precorrin-2 C(20)-methyltransferase [Streptomyces sp. ICBB 8177]PWI44380.1 precorrin-3B C(17)-methyltransferase [Streptomyces sp. ICBB 8177]